MGTISEPVQVEMRSQLKSHIGMWNQRLPEYILAHTLWSAKIGRMKILIMMDFLSKLTSSINLEMRHLPVSTLHRRSYIIRKLSASFGQAIQSGNGSHTFSSALRPKEAAYFTNRAASHLNLKDFRSAMADYQRAISLSTFKPSAKTFIRLAECHLATGCTMAALIALRDAHSVDPSCDAAKALKAKAIALNGHIADFHSARSRDHLRMAQAAYDECRLIILDFGGTMPVEWLCWKIELETARGNWEVALSESE